MSRTRMSKRAFPSVITAFAAALFMGTALASNMTFKFNAPVQNPTSRGGTATCTQCGNWISLPFVNQFVGLRLSAICALSPDFAFVFQPGTATGNGPTTVLDETRIDALAFRGCSVTNPLIGTDPIYQRYTAIRIQLKTATTGDKSQIFVGADDPAAQQLVRNSTVRGGTATWVQCGNWVHLPYHTTAQRLSDICAEIGPKAGFVYQPGSCTGNGTSTVCNFNAIDSLAFRTCAVTNLAIGTNPPVQIGKAVRIELRKSGSTPTDGDVLWSPSHY